MARSMMCLRQRNMLGHGKCRLQEVGASNDGVACIDYINVFAHRTHFMTAESILL